MYDRLIRANISHVNVFRREDIPLRFHYANSSRSPPLVLLADPDYAIFPGQNVSSKSSHFSPNNHNHLWLRPHSKIISGPIILAFYLCISSINLSVSRIKTNFDHRSQWISWLRQFRPSNVCIICGSWAEFAETGKCAGNSTNWHLPVDMRHSATGEAKQNRWRFAKGHAANNPSSLIRVRGHIHALRTRRKFPPWPNPNHHLHSSQCTAYNCSHVDMLA